MTTKMTMTCTVDLFNPRDLVNMPLEEILQLRPENMMVRVIPRFVFEYIASELRVFWKHDGDMSKPHAELTSGVHSGGFINAGELLSYIPLCELFAASLAGTIQEQTFWPGYVVRHPWAVGSDHADAVFAQRVGYYLLATRYEFSDKGGKDGKDQVWSRHTLKESERPFHVEELITTFTTADRVRKGIREFHGRHVEFSGLATLVHRPDMRKFPEGLPPYEGKPVISSYFYDIPTYDVPNGEGCDLCDAGSKVVKSPKKNWEQLTQG